MALLGNLDVWTFQPDVNRKAARWMQIEPHAGTDAWGQIYLHLETEMAFDAEA